MAVASCAPSDNGEDEKEEQKENNEQQKPALSPGDYKFVASEVKGSWKAGDKIYVHGAHGLKSEVLTISADNLSQEGKVATLALDKVTASFLKPDGLYAAYPSDEAERYVGSLKTSLKFLSIEGPRCVAYLSGDTFSFVDVTGVLSFTVSGDYDKFAFCANNRAGLRGQELTAEVTSAGSTFTVSNGDGYPFLYGDVPSDGKCSIWFPAGLKFPNGYSIFLGKNGSWDHIYKTTASLSLTGEAVDLGTIEPVAYDGPVPVLPSITDEKKIRVEVSELSGICLSEDKSFLWGADDDGSLAKIEFDANGDPNVVDPEFYHYVIGDVEDLCLDPRNGDIILGLESPGSVGVIRAPITTKSKGSKLFNVSDFSNFGNSGLEGLTYYKDNLIFVGSQSGPYLELFNLDGTLLWKTVLPYKNPVSEVAGLCYDPLTNWLWLIDSETKEVYIYVVNAEEVSATQWNVNLDYLGAYPVSKPANPESVCVDHVRHCIWVGDDYDDYSYIYRYDMEGLDDFIIN